MALETFPLSIMTTSSFISAIWSLLLGGQKKYQENKLSQALWTPFGTTFVKHDISWSSRIIMVWQKKICQNQLSYYSAGLEASQKRTSSDKQRKLWAWRWGLNLIDPCKFDIFKHRHELIRIFWSKSFLLFQLRCSNVSDEIIIIIITVKRNHSCNIVTPVSCFNTSLQVSHNPLKPKEKTPPGSPPHCWWGRDAWKDLNDTRNLPVFSDILRFMGAIQFKGASESSTYNMNYLSSDFRRIEISDVCCIRSRSYNYPVFFKGFRRSLPPHFVAKIRHPCLLGSSNIQDPFYTE